MSANDIAVRGGTVVDGTGGPARRADVGIRGGRITEIAERVEGAREIDATGQLVVPGFLDIHTHYDPQVLWDGLLTPSSWHGVTGVVAGNCGYSLAPARPQDRRSLLGTLAMVEDMRAETLAAGVAWDFETYPEYLDAVARRGTAIHFGGFVGHTAVRTYVMGEAAYDRPATGAELDRMRAVVADSLRGGALGFSSDRAGFHLGDGGRLVPSMVAEQAEVEALAQVTAETGRGIVHIATGENYGWVYDFQRRLGRPLTWTSILTYPEGTASRAPYAAKLADHLAGRRAGADVWAQVTCRPITQEFSVAEPTSFYSLPAFAELVAVPVADRHRVYRDTAWRSRAWAEFTSGKWLNPRWETITVAHSPARPDLVGRSVTAIAAERGGGTAFDVVCDLALEDRLACRFTVTFANDDVEGVTTLLRGEGCLMGLSDAGAHVSQICDAVMPTDFLSRWVRDRDVMPVEEGVHKLTGQIAGVLGLDRGRLHPGAHADLAVLDYAALSPGPVRRVRDLPADGERLIADEPAGLDHVLVAGVPIRTHGRPATAGLDRLPGTILRSTPTPEAHHG
ncbi:N-acyl-D-amino-acid deacylase family protein [Yinghuangia soli]|uniref:Amidohydrolase family protein n=1 Tax=Yinghuangia soli TaxID=2908204 RepID=A0AA41U2M9_9ACTN|nr:amidohydrolase family protein [Yinghuangia soli]MCF2531943.1 amidohydrolase family protein [Yinghuangia soli]